MPVSGHWFPPDTIDFAVQWHVQFRLMLAEVAELLADRGAHFVRSAAYASVHHRQIALL
jgi:transposase-like protein